MPDDNGLADNQLQSLGEVFCCLYYSHRRKIQSFLRTEHYLDLRRTFAQLIAALANFSQLSLFIFHNNIFMNGNLSSSESL